MGHEIPNTIGNRAAAAGSSAHAGPSSSNGHSAGAVGLVRLEGDLMYQDDHDWLEYQDEDDDDMADADVLDSSGNGDFTKADAVAAANRHRKGTAAAKRMPIQREEVVRLILQGLRDIGYDRSADTLEAESGYQLSTQSASDFQAAILGGRWSEAIQLLDDLGLPTSSTSSIAETSSSNSSIASGKTKATAVNGNGNGNSSNADKARFLIAQQKYLEYLEIGQQKKALSVLRGELARLTRDSEILHSMSGYMMCLDRDDLYERAEWDGAAGTSRRQLLEKLQAFVSPQVMVPSRRLATLLDQARRHQQESCLYHDDGEPSSLYVDHECSSGQFPNIYSHILADHDDEVWLIDWSPDGSMLASSGKDHKVVIWQLKIGPQDEAGNAYSVVPLHHLNNHHDEVEAMAWSPDSKTLVTGANKSLYIWDIKSGTQKSSPSTSSQHADTISTIHWMPDGSEFLVASLDCKLIFYGPTGVVRKTWSFNTLQIKDFVIMPDQKSIVAGTTSLKRVAIESKLKQAVSTLDAANVAGLPRDFGYGAMEHNLVTIRLGDKEIIDWSHDLRRSVTSLSLSWDKKRILLSAGPEVQLWSLNPSLRFLRRFVGHVHNRYVIRSGFGATKDRFVLSGSEDGNVYVWQSNTGQSVEVLMGHKGVVNAVAWNPISSRRIFASCSDDASILIWQAPGGINESEMNGMTLETAQDEDIELEETSAEVPSAGLGETEGMVL